MAPGLNELLLWHGTSRKAGLEVSMQPASSKLARVLYDGVSEHIRSWKCYRINTL